MRNAYACCDVCVCGEHRSAWGGGQSEFYWANWVLQVGVAGSTNALDATPVRLKDGAEMPAFLWCVYEGPLTVCGRQNQGYMGADKFLLNQALLFLR